MMHHVIVSFSAVNNGLVNTHPHICTIVSLDRIPGRGLAGSKRMYIFVCEDINGEPFKNVASRYASASSMF